MTARKDLRVARIVQRLKKRELYEHADRISRNHHVLIEEMLSEGKQRPFVQARQKFWLFLHDALGFSWPVVAALFEKRSDSVVHVTRYKESRARQELEGRVATRIAGYVRSAGYDALAQQIDSGAWRDVCGATSAESEP